MEIHQLLLNLKKLKLPIKNKLNAILFNYCYYAVDENSNIVFLIPTSNNSNKIFSQETEKLLFLQNINCSIDLDNEILTKDFDIIICLDKKEENIETFLHLTSVYSKCSESKIDIKTFFNSLKNLFTNKTKPNMKELQGFYGELYFIYFMNLHQKNIASFLHSDENMKFDFSLSETKKIEVKTTTGEIRKHNFNHEQLASDVFDIWVVSFLFRKDDEGLSLLKLVQIVKKYNPLNIKFHTYIANFLINFSEKELIEMSFNETYTKNNLKIFKAEDIHKMPNPKPLTVSNVKYESDLSSVRGGDIEKFKDWINS